jgi:hypothetical protein
VDEHRRFLQMLFLRLNAGRTQRLIEEMAVMRDSGQNARIPPRVLDIPSLP